MAITPRHSSAQTASMGDASTCISTNHHRLECNLPYFVPICHDVNSRRLKLTFNTRLKTSV
jgi:hypothetical protein